MGLYQRRFLQNSFRRCGSQFIGIVFMKNIKNQLYFELLETTIYQWFGRTVRIHNSTTTARRVIIIKDKFHRSQRTSRRFCAKVIIYYFGSLISTLQSLLGLCLSLGLQATAPLLRFPKVWFEYIPPKFVNLKLGLSNTSLVSAPFLPPILEFAVYYNNYDKWILLKIY